MKPFHRTLMRSRKLNSLGEAFRSNTSYSMLANVLKNINVCMNLGCFNIKIDTTMRVPHELKRLVLQILGSQVVSFQDNFTNYFDFYQ